MNISFLQNEKTRESVTYILLSFAMGGLLGDVFFHTIPHMSAGHSHDHGQGHNDHHDNGAHKEEEL